MIYTASSGIYRQHQEEEAPECFECDSKMVRQTCWPEPHEWFCISQCGCKRSIFAKVKVPPFQEVVHLTAMQVRGADSHWGML